MKLKCSNCSYEWDYKGKNTYYATCPDCLNKVKLKGGLKCLEEKKKLKKQSQ